MRVSSLAVAVSLSSLGCGSAPPPAPSGVAGSPSVNPAPISAVSTAPSAPAMASAAASSPSAPPNGSAPTPTRKPEPAADETGGEDEHGCIMSAGFTWSPLRKACLRLFEKGLRLDPVPPPKGAAAEISAFVIFATDDRSPSKNESIELVILQEPAPLLLTRSKKPGVYAKEGSPFTVTAGKTWTIEKNGTVIYKQGK